MLPTVRGPSFVNRLHEFLGPTHRVRNCAQGCRNSFPAIELCQFARSEDTRRDQQHAFAALVHVEEFSFFAFCSPRALLGLYMNRRRCEITGVKFRAGLLNH